MSLNRFAWINNNQNEIVKGEKLTSLKQPKKVPVPPLLKAYAEWVKKCETCAFYGSCVVLPFSPKCCFQPKETKKT
ncbi:MAG: hypothetical protein GF383_00715 [Candidatus Lokiarchaeota archaeon]|nr:hypothetical protein [Candidatus Lokiarchaeota archaeon]MBD3337695.1 hypothetical protein [Candidatus Lokiarchaeota archaeon]